MKPFKKNEIKKIGLILLVLFITIYMNMIISLRRGRDNIRKNDIYTVEQALDTYYQKYRVYPLSTNDGQIIGCFSGQVIYDKVTGMPVNMEICEWGKSAFEDAKQLPNDPQYKDGAKYRYESDGKGYFFYISLEGHDEAEFNQNIANKNLQCGTHVCNYGRGAKI